VKNIEAALLVEYLDWFSLRITKETVIIFDNASVHRWAVMRQK